MRIGCLRRGGEQGEQCQGENMDHRRLLLDSRRMRA
jgi:hypothetical protein